MKRISLKQYEALYDDESPQGYPEHAGGYACFMLVYLDFEDRRPVGVRGMECERFKVFSDGRIDKSERRRRTDLAMQSYESVLRPREPGFIDGTNRFNRRRIEHEFKWRPSKVQLAEVGRLIFGSRG